MATNLEADVTAVSRIDVIPSILEVVCRMTGMGFAAVARVTEDRWVACAVRDEIDFGLKPGGELKIETTICNEIRTSGRGVVIDHVALDPAYRSHHTPAMYGFQSYISLPIVRRNGEFFGTLCAIDPKPAKVTRPEVVRTFELFAGLIAFHLESQDQLSAATAQLAGEREIAQLREQFVAVLGHDLRTPLMSIQMSTELLKRQTLTAQGMATVTLIQRSVARMKEMINDVLDLARVRLGNGLELAKSDVLVSTDLEQVIEELQMAWPERRVEAHFSLSAPVQCDRIRIGQLFSNLVGNAFAHGDRNAPVRIEVTGTAQELSIAVANRGRPIDPQIRKGLFEPFRRHGTDGSDGLGLGLYIASEIARAHGGAIDVTSSEAETVFHFHMPVSPARSRTP